MLNFLKIECPVFCLPMLLFTDDFGGLPETGPALQNLIDVVHNYSKCWRFETNIKKSAVVIFSQLGNYGG